MRRTLPRRPLLDGCYKLAAEPLATHLRAHPQRVEPYAAVLDDAADQTDRRPVLDRDDLQRGGVEQPLPPPR